MEMANDYEIEDFSNAKGWFKKAVKNLGGEITKLVKDPKGTLKQASDRAVDVTKDTAKNLGKETAKFSNKAWKAIKKYNPLSVLARAGTLVAFRVNFLALSRKMYPHVTADDKAWKNVSNFWKNDMGGKVSELKKMIEKSHDKPIFKLKKKSSFDGEDEFSNFAGVDDAVEIISAMTPIVTMIKEMRQNGVEVEDPDGELGTANPEEMEAIKKASQEDIAKGSQDDDSDIFGDDEILGIPKPYFWGGVAVLGLIATIIIIKVVKKK